jgi:hypothetical protein
LNIGLDPTGVWAPGAVTTLLNVTAWMAFGAEGVHNTTTTFPFQYAPNDGNGYDLVFTASTQRASTYVFVLPNADAKAAKRALQQAGAGTAQTMATGGKGRKAGSKAAPLRGDFTGLITIGHFKATLLTAMPTAVTLLSPAGPVPLAFNITPLGMQLQLSDVFPPYPLPLVTWYRDYGNGHVDNAPCGLRDCSVYQQAGYAQTGVEGYCTSAPGGEPYVPVYLWYNNADDNMGAPAAPASGGTWSLYDTECFAFVNNGTNRWRLEVWYSAAKTDYWTLASPQSRAAAQAQGYVFVSAVGFVDASSPYHTPAGAPVDAAAAQLLANATVQTYAGVLRVDWA